MIRIGDLIDFQGSSNLLNRSLRRNLYNIISGCFVSLETYVLGTFAKHLPLIIKTPGGF